MDLIVVVRPRRRRRHLFLNVEEPGAPGAVFPLPLFIVHCHSVQSRDQ